MNTDKILAAAIIGTLLLIAAVVARVRRKCDECGSQDDLLPKHNGRRICGRCYYIDGGK